MTKKIDCVWYWDGGTEVGRWRRADAGTRAAIRRGGRVAHDGTAEDGPPSTPPSADEFNQLSVTDRILGAVVPNQAMLDAMQQELVSLFSMDGTYARALHVARLGWACAEVLRQQQDTFIAERDEARRMYCHAVMSEHHTRLDEPVIAARKWGREAALALYTDEILHDMYFEWNFDEEEVAQDIAETRRRLDAEFPA